MPRRPNTRPSGVRALLIGTDPHVLASLARKVRDVGHELVGMAGNAQEGLQRTLEKLPNLVLLDFGTQTAAADLCGEVLRSIDIRCRVPVVLVLDRDEFMTHSRVTSVSPDGYLVKPVTDASLRVVCGLIRRPRLDAAVAQVRSSREWVLPGLERLPIALHFEDEFERVVHTTSRLREMFNLPDADSLLPGLPTRLLLDHIRTRCRRAGSRFPPSLRVLSRLPYYSTELQLHDGRHLLLEVTGVYGGGRFRGRWWTYHERDR